MNNRHTEIIDEYFSSYKYMELENCRTYREIIIFMKNNLDKDTYFELESLLHAEIAYVAEKSFVTGLLLHKRNGVFI